MHYVHLAAQRVCFRLEDERHPARRPRLVACPAWEAIAPRPRSNAVTTITNMTMIIVGYNETKIIARYNTATIYEQTHNTNFIVCVELSRLWMSFIIAFIYTTIQFGRFVEMKLMAGEYITFAIGDGHQIAACRSVLCERIHLRSHFWPFSFYWFYVCSWCDLWASPWFMMVLPGRYYNVWNIRLGIVLLVISFKTELDVENCSFYS